MPRNETLFAATGQDTIFIVLHWLDITGHDFLESLVDSIRDCLGQKTFEPVGTDDFLLRISQYLTAPLVDESDLTLVIQGKQHNTRDIEVLLSPVTFPQDFPLCLYLLGSILEDGHQAGLSRDFDGLDGYNPQPFFTMPGCQGHFLVLHAAVFFDDRQQTLSIIGFDEQIQIQVAAAKSLFLAVA